MSEKAIETEVIYPRRHVDVSGLVGWYDPRDEDWSGQAYSALAALRDGVPVVIDRGSVDREEILTRSGVIGLHGGNLRWHERDREVALTELWEKRPSLRPYLRSRTMFVLERKRKEAETLRRIGMQDDAAKLEAAITRLERELAELPES